jgi:predicted ATPase
MFKDFDINFVDEHDEALPIIVLAGVNGSGKTTLLECLGLTNIENQLYFTSYENHLLTLTLSNEIKWWKKNMELEDDTFLQEDALHYYLIQEEEKIKDYMTNSIYISSGIDDTKKVVDEFVKTFYDFLKNHDYRPSEVKEHFHKYMMEIFDGIELTFKYSHLDKEDNVWFKNDEGKEFQIDKLSTGEKTLLSKILYIYFKDYKDKIILIDEPELSLHPSWQNKILSVYEKLAKQNNCQIIIATHSPHIIGSAKNEYLRILRKNEEGNVEVVEDLKAEGRDINSILFDVMGEVAYRPREFDDKIDRLHIAIDDRKLEEANERLKELKKSYGENDEVVMEAQMLIDMFSRDAE